jgi:hypothetical protein
MPGAVGVSFVAALFLKGPDALTFAFSLFAREPRVL